MSGIIGDGNINNDICYMLNSYGIRMVKDMVKDGIWSQIQRWFIAPILQQEFKMRCEDCVHCDKSTLTELSKAYCNKLQIPLNNYTEFFCAYWSTCEDNR